MGNVVAPDQAVVSCAPARTNAELARLVPYPAASDNKYTRGHAYLVVGSSAYPGAACLCAAGATRMGAGYTEVFCAGKSMLTVRTWMPSLVVRDWHTWQPAALKPASAAHPRACVIGCGFNTVGSHKFLSTLLMNTLASFDGPVLVDGGALELLATETGLRLARERAEAGRALMLTPHSGEAAKLAEGAKRASTSELAEGAKRAEAAKLAEGAATLSLSPSLPAPDLACALARTYQAVVALKGPVTYIAAPSGHVEIIDRGTAALAKAGTGDVLAGMIGGLLAQGLDPLDAAALGCALHAEAGRAAALDRTTVCVTADDVPAYIPQALRAICANHTE